MPDEPRTVRDAGHTGLATLKGLVAFGLGNPILDALIGAQGRVVYTAEDVERAVDALRQGIETVVWDSGEVVRKILTAAGGVVVDKVMTQAVDMVDGDNGSVRWLNSTGPNEEWSFLDLRPGDKLYIVRAGTASRSEEE